MNAFYCQRIFEKKRFFSRIKLLVFDYFVKEYSNLLIFFTEVPWIVSFIKYNKSEDCQIRELFWHEF